MKQECRIKGGLREQREKLQCLALFLTWRRVLSSFFASLGLCERTAVAFCFGCAAAVLSGCATSPAKVAQQPAAAVAPVTNQGPSVSRLEDGRKGFVIRENPAKDAEWRGDFERAIVLMNDGKNDKAIELLTSVIERSPGVTAPYIDLAEAYLRTGKPESAEQHLKTALGLVPGHPVASNEYGLLLRKAGRFKEAREVYEKALEGFPDYLPVHRNLGILCDLYLSDPECALRQFEIYSEGMPGDGQVKIWIAELRMRIGRQ